MEHALAAVWSIIHSNPEAAVLEASVFGHLLRYEQQMTQQRLLVFPCSAQARKPVLVLGDNQEMHRRLRCDVVKREALVVLVDHIRGDLSGHDLIKDRDL